jgi:hypothetical protein
MKLALLTVVFLGLAAAGCAWSTDEPTADANLQSTAAFIAETDDEASLRETPAFVCAGANPASALDFAVLTKPETVFDTGSIRITASVKNLGNAPFIATPNGHLAKLYGRGPGGRYFLLAEEAFRDLAPGESVSFSIERAWSPSYEPWEGFRVVIVHGSETANDCFLGDNVVERPRQDINALFH